METKIVNMAARQLVGLKTQMSITNPKTLELWQSFGPRISEIEQKLGRDKISMAIYSPHHFKAFNPEAEFEKWAAVEVQNQSSIPEGLESFEIPAGTYAVFHYRGSSADPSVFQYIFSEWLPKSGFQIDDRPHFEILGDKYRNNDPNSEEEIWIPIK